jgi:hypothetical protein
MIEKLGTDSEEKHEPVSDIDTVVADSLKVLDLKLVEAQLFHGHPERAREVMVRPKDRLVPTTKIGRCATAGPSTKRP